MNLLKQLKTKKYAVAGAAVLAIAVSAVIGINTVKAYASEDYWEVKIGEKTAAVLTSESEAKQVIRDVKNHYVREGAVVKSIQCDPAMTVEMKSYRVSERPEVSTLDVTVTQKVTETKQIKFKTVTQTSSEALKNTTVVKQQGRCGEKEVTRLVTTKNGAVTDTEEIDSRIIRQPKKQIILKGTGILPAPPAGKTYSGNGAAVAQYALRFVGNPYVYGGSSLTDGADCSGFVMAVYRHFGITMAHDAGVQRTYGKEVSLAAAQPGDLVCFYGHIGIYIGGGQIVHAVNEGMGIAVTGATYTGPVISVRRIVE